MTFSIPAPEEVAQKQEFVQAGHPYRRGDLVTVTPSIGSPIELQVVRTREPDTGWYGKSTAGLCLAPLTIGWFRSMMQKNWNEDGTYRQTLTPPRRKSMNVTSWLFYLLFLVGLLATTTWPIWSGR